MLTMRESVTPLLGAMVVVCAASSALRAQSEPYPATLYFGTGLINTPVAWVSPRNAEVWLNTSAKNLPSIPNSGAMNFMTRMNSNISIDTHWGGRASVGAVAYSQNPEWGFFGQLLALRQGDYATYMPALAVGLRNVGKYKHEDRFFIGEDIQLQGDEYNHVVDERYKDFNTANTVYLVASEDFLLGSAPGSNAVSVSLGWGNGLFQDDGGLGDAYNNRGTIASGLFAGARFVAHPSLNTTLTVMAENDGWDYNAGIVFDWRGLSAGLYGTELEEGGSKKASGFFVYNYAKYNIAIGYSGNIVDISKGVILRTRITELTREQQRLKYEIADRNRRIRGLEVALTRAQASEVATLERRRQDLERQVQEERDAIRRAEERLRQLDQSQTKPPAAPAKPPTTPPSH